MADQYTHTYEFKVGEHGESVIKGECEFNQDGLMTYKIANSSDPLTKQTLELFTEFMDLLHKIYKNSTGIELIKIKQKE